MKCQNRCPQTIRQAAVIEKAEYQGPKHVCHNVSHATPKAHKTTLRKEGLAHRAHTPKRPFSLLQHVPSQAG